MKTVAMAIVMIAVVSLSGVILISLQPEKAHVERSIIIKGTPEQITARLETSQSFSEWSPWNKERPSSGFKLLTFQDFGGTVYSNIILKQDDSGTRVTWIYDGVNDGVKGKASWLLLKRNIIDQYENGLAILKRLVEENPIAQPDSTLVQ